MSTSANLKGLPLAVLCVAAMLALSNCRKDGEQSYAELILFTEPFDSWQNMSTTPINATLDSTFVGVSNGKLELNFNPSTYDGDELGCEWERLDVTSPYLEHIGVRVILDSGYFQSRTQHLTELDYRKKWTTMRLLYSDLEMYVPNGSLGHSADSVVAPGIFRIEGRVLEFIRDGSSRFFIVDGVPHPLTEVQFTSLGYSHHWLHVWFELGRTNEPDPGIDHLGVDKIEIFTWTGERPD